MAPEAAVIALVIALVLIVIALWPAKRRGEGMSPVRMQDTDVEALQGMDINAA